MASVLFPPSTPLCLSHPRFTTQRLDPFTTLSNLLVHESYPVHRASPHRIFVPIYTPHPCARSKRTRQSTFLVFHLGFMYILVVSSRRLKRPLSSSLYRTLHHSTSILPIPGTSLYSISRPFAFLGFLSGFSFTLHLRRIPQSSSHPLYLTNSYSPHAIAFFTPTTACVSYPRY